MHNMMIKNTNYLISRNNCPGCTSLKNKLAELGVSFHEINMDIKAQKAEGDALLKELSVATLLFGGLPLLLCVDALGYVSRHVQGSPPMAEVKKSLGIKTGRKR